MNFRKRNLSLMLKTFGTQIIMSLLGVMLYAGVSEIPALLIVGTVCSIGIYFYLVYKPIWKEACQESLRPAEEQTNFGPLTGLLIVFFASIPGIVFTLIPVLFPLQMSETGNPQTSVSQVFWLVEKFFFNGQYTGILQSFFPLSDTQTAAENFAAVKAQIPWHLLCSLPTMAVGAFAYALGLKDRSLGAFFGLDSSKSDRPILK